MDIILGNLTNNENIEFLYKEITKVIDNSKRNVVAAINSEMVVLYWNIGKIIKSQILLGEKAEYGKSVISDLSKALTKEYETGYSQRNIFNMIKFFEIFHDEQILQTLSGKLFCTHL